MYTSTSRTRCTSSSRDLAVNFAATLDPTGKLPPVQTRRGKSLAFYSRSPKAVALSRIKYLTIQQAGRVLLAFYVQVARGKKARSWFSDAEIATMLPRSGGGSYSRHHIRRWRKILEIVGFIRTIEVLPGAPLPSRENPDEDKGFTDHAGRLVVEVNLAACAGLEAVWRNVVRGGWQEDRDAREAAEELRAELEAEEAEREAKRAQLAALDASPEPSPVDEARQLPEPDPQPSPAAASRQAPADPSRLEDARRDEAHGASEGKGNEACGGSERAITHAHGGAITDAHPSVNSGSPSENKTFDPGGADADRRAPCRAPETHAHAGTGRTAALTAAEPPRPTASAPPGLVETRATNEKSTSRTTMVGDVPRIPRAIADKLRQLGMPVAYGSVEGEGPAVSSPATLAPAVRGPSYRGQVDLLGGADLAPQGRHGERLPGGGFRLGVGGNRGGGYSP